MGSALRKSPAVSGSDAGTSGFVPAISEASAMLAASLAASIAFCERTYAFVPSVISITVLSPSAGEAELSASTSFAKRTFDGAFESVPSFRSVT